MPHRLAEGGIAERLAVVAEPDVIGERLEPVPVVEAVVNGLGDRNDDEDGVERDRRPDVQADLQPLACDAAGGGPRERAAQPLPCLSSWLRRRLRRHFFFAADAIRATTCAGVALPANWSAVAASSAWPIERENAMSR